MIFVTVGTHEQQFNRLVESMDRWSASHDEEVVIQTGFSTYEPLNCRWKHWFTSTEMEEYMEKARIVITHGGPSSFIAPLQKGKTPIVVPRDTQYDEHVNCHQIAFCRLVSERMGTIIEIEDMDKLAKTLDNYDDIVKNMNKGYPSNNAKFCADLEDIIDKMFK